MIQDDFIFMLFFGNLMSMVLSIAFFAVCLFLAGKVLDTKQNTAKNALQTAFVAFIIGIVIAMLAFVPSIFALPIMFFASLWAITQFYKTDYYNAAILLMLAIIIFTIIEWATAPWLIGI